MARLSIEDRFESKVWFKPGCWAWMASKFPNGYGQFNAGVQVGLRPGPWSPGRAGTRLSRNSPRRHLDRLGEHAPVPVHLLALTRLRGHQGGGEPLPGDRILRPPDLLSEAIDVDVDEYE
jgi:hypothetical protein